MSAGTVETTAPIAARAKPRRKSELVRDVERELEAARVLREQIADLADGDEEFVRDSLEGETDLDGLVRNLVASIGEDEALAEGLKGYQSALADRMRRLEGRADTKRALLLSALEIAGRPSIETDIGTVSLRPVPPKAIQTEPADIPAEFWAPQPPKVDSRALLAALKTAAAEGRSIPGATLSNGSQTISIRKA